MIPAFPQFDHPVEGRLVTAWHEWNADGTRREQREIEVVEPVRIFGVDIPAGFRSDGATVPVRAAYYVADPFGAMLNAAIVHDLRWGLRVFPDCDQIYDRRAWSDNELYRNVRLCGFNIIRARAVRRAVRLFGGRMWDAGTERLRTAA